jgi:hypothetical protein
MVSGRSICVAVAVAALTNEREQAEAQDDHDGDYAHHEVDPGVTLPRVLYVPHVPRHAVEQVHHSGHQGDVEDGGGQLGCGAQDLQPAR